MMEVSGKKAETKVELCKPCKQRKVSAYAGGYCTQCAEHMCKSCFDTHKQFKLNRGHRLVNADEAESSGKQLEEYVLCGKHSQEPVKFFCPHHDQVGCGDCMILDHKTCKVDYVRDLVNDFLGNKDYMQFRKDTEKHYNEAKRVKTSINNNKDQIKDVNAKFKQDVIKFKDELITHITKLANALLKCGDDTMITDLSSLDSLDKVNESVIEDTSRINQALRSLTDQPYKLFISSIEYRQKLRQVQTHLDKIKEENKYQRYTFERDDSLERLLQDCQQLGYLKKDNQMDEAGKKRADSRQTRPNAEIRMPLSKQINQPLDQRQKFCRNLNIDGQILSYAARKHGEVGLYVDNRTLREGGAFEIEILSIGGKSNIGLGVAREHYQNNLLLGIEKGSVGYHSDGRVYIRGYDKGNKGDKWKIGDKVRCTIASGEYENVWELTFSHNGRKIFRSGIFYWDVNNHFAVGMNGTQNKVKVILDS